MHVRRTRYESLHHGVGAFSSAYLQVLGATFRVALVRLTELAILITAPAFDAVLCAGELVHLPPSLSNSVDLSTGIIMIQ